MDESRKRRRVTQVTDERLQALPGIGDWTANYIAMRALGWPDAFPSGDLGLLHGLSETAPARLRALADPWRPWRAYAVMHVWNGLEMVPSRRRS